ncbi:hypothetical protein SSYM_2077 [Serratia symbiotica str. Tucson]|uniref:Uncharacterized protein n=1 Tax=Serratia symbiotica str. Tucson TaxID=914128 RepID=E9CNQ4_9GAMM|nr:hypothetical protein SSYM_2077 [Serratia symbiotica str. Tucson]
MNVGAHQPGGMRTGKFVIDDLLPWLSTQLGTGRMADVHLAVGQTRQHRQPSVKRRRLFGDDHLRISSQRLAVYDSDENGTRRTTGARCFTEQPGALRRPQTAGEQFAFHLFTRQLRQCIDRVVRERQLPITTVLQRNHHRLQYAALATINGDDATTGWCREDNPRVLFIFKQRLAFLNGIAFLYQHGGTHCDILLPKQGNMLNLRTIKDRLNRRSSYGQIQPFCDFNHRICTMLNGLHVIPAGSRDGGRRCQDDETMRTTSGVNVLAKIPT